METPASEPAISVQHADFSYNGRQVLTDCTLEVQPGEFLGLVGPNGGGKTTLLRLMLGELQPTSGRVSVLGMTAAELGRRRSRIGYVPQRETLEWDFPASARDVVVMGAFSARGIGHRVGREAGERARHLLEVLGVPEIADRPIDKLSGGQQQRVFVARALVGQPQLLLLDEPTRGIDIGGIEAFFGQIRRLQREMGLTVVMSSHDLQHLRHVADRMACLCGGVHWHERSDMVSDELLDEVGKVCELEAFIAHSREHHEGQCSEGETCEP